MRTSTLGAACLLLLAVAIAFLYAFDALEFVRLDVTAQADALLPGRSGRAEADPVAGWFSGGAWLLDAGFVVLILLVFSSPLWLRKAATTTGAAVARLSNSARKTISGGRLPGSAPAPVPPQAAPPGALTRLLARLNAAARALASPQAAGPSTSVPELSPASSRSFDDAARQKSPDSAELALASYVAGLPSDDGRSRGAAAIALAKKGAFDAAIAEFQAAVKANPTDPGAHFHLGMLFAGRRRHAEAIKAFNAFLAQSGQSNPAHKEFARSQIALLRARIEP